MYLTGHIPRDIKPRLLTRSCGPILRDRKPSNACLNAIQFLLKWYRIDLSWTSNITRIATLRGSAQAWHYLRPRPNTPWDANNIQFIPTRYITFGANAGYPSIPLWAFSMEQARASDNSSPPSTVNLPTTFGQEDPLLSTPDRREFDAENQASPSPPSTTDSQHAKKSRFSRFEPLPSKPLLEGFERPSFSRIAILTALCPAAYPAFYLLTLIARDRSLFVVRFMVSMWCSAVGFVLGYILLKIGAQHLEAASKFTLVDGSETI